jgi:hypothetical protein
MAYETLHKLDTENGEIVEKIGQVYFNEKNPSQDGERAFVFFNKAIKKLKSEVGKQNLALRMYDYCVANG